MKLSIVCILVGIAFVHFVACATANATKDPSSKPEKPAKEPAKQPTVSSISPAPTMPTSPSNATTHVPFWIPCTLPLCWLDCVALRRASTGVCVNEKCECKINLTKASPAKKVCVTILCWLDCVLIKSKKGGECVEQGQCKCSKDAWMS